MYCINLPQMPEQLHCVCKLDRACSEAKIGLSQLPPNITYEIIIGSEGNTKSSILKEGLYGNQTTSYPNMLSCDRLVDFWISWERDGLISVGQGDFGQGTFLTWKDSAPVSIHAIAIATGDASQDGYWEIYEDAG